MQMLPAELKKTLPAGHRIEVDQAIREGYGAAIYANKAGKTWLYTFRGGQSTDFPGECPESCVGPEGFETLWLQDFAEPPVPEATRTKSAYDRFHDVYSAQNSQINLPPRPPSVTQYPLEHKW